MASSNLSAEHLAEAQQPPEQRQRRVLLKRRLRDSHIDNCTAAAAGTRSGLHTLRTPQWRGWERASTWLVTNYLNWWKRMCVLDFEQFSKQFKYKRKKTHLFSWITPLLATFSFEKRERQHLCVVPLKSFLGWNNLCFCFEIWEYASDIGNIFDTRINDIQKITFEIYVSIECNYNFKRFIHRNVCFNYIHWNVCFNQMYNFKRFECLINACIRTCIGSNADWNCCVNI